MNIFNDFFTDLADYVINPTQKTYFLYLLSSLVIAFVYLLFFSAGEKSFATRLRSYLFNRAHWTGASPANDYYLTVLNAGLRALFIVPFFLSGLSLSYKFAGWLIINFDSPLAYTGSNIPVIAGYTVCLWLLGDFSRFLLHYLAHRIPFLWEFHKVHHSATVLNPFTLYRQHPVEMFLFHIRGSLVFGLVTGVFYYYYSGSLGIVEVLGVNAGRFVFLVAGSNLRHSHVPLSYGRWLEHIFISPLQHQIHHSIHPRDHHKNMGSHLALWDWMFGTLKISEKGKHEYEFGIPDGKAENFNSFAGSLWLPFRAIFRKWKGKANRSE